MTLRQHPVLTGTAAERPTTGAHTGQVFIATDTGAKTIWDGSTWVAV